MGGVQALVEAGHGGVMLSLPVTGVSFHARSRTASILVPSIVVREEDAASRRSPASPSEDHTQHQAGDGSGGADQADRERLGPIMELHHMRAPRDAGLQHDPREPL